jgi:hypothetical protein
VYLSLPCTVAQAYALSQLAIACRSPEDCPRASRTSVLQRSLAALVLPHTFRLPLPAVAPALPSALFIPAADGEVVEVISQTLMAAIGVLAMPAGEPAVPGAAVGVPVPTELPWAGLVVRAGFPFSFMGCVSVCCVSVCGRWALGSGQWAVGSGQWAVGSGQCALGVGRWAVGSGQWAVGVGQWALGSGQ